MSVSRRDFIHKSIAAGSLFPLFSMSYDRDVINIKNNYRGEDYWNNVAGMYHQNVKFINLESGYFSPSPESVKDYWINYVNEINESPSYYMRNSQVVMREKVREKLATYSGIKTSELVLTRNTTESMNIIIQGIKLRRGDEILRTNLEYPNIIQALDMRERRFGTKVRVVDFPNQPTNQQEILYKLI